MAAIRQGPRANTHHTLQGYMISKVFEWATLDSKDSNWFSLTLELPVMSCIRQRVWRQVLPNTNSTISCCVITGKPFKNSEPQFLLSLYLPTYLSIHPSIHPPVFYLHLSQQVVVKRKRGSINREALWKLQMHKLIAIVQMMIDGQGLRA